MEDKPHLVGGVAEWLNAPVLKTDVGESLPWVRIPPPPPLTFDIKVKNQIIYKLPAIVPTNVFGVGGGLEKMFRGRS